MNIKVINFINLSLILFFAISCGEDRSSDRTPPTVWDVRFNVNDTIKYIGDDKLEKIILLNDSTIAEDETVDILVIGKPIRFRGSFADEEGLSNVFLHIWGDSSHINDEGIKIPLDEVTDTCYQLKRIVPIHMFGEKEKEIRGMGVAVADILEPKLYRKSRNKELRVRPTGERVKDNYLFTVFCSDMVGNENSETYFEHPILIYTRETIIEEHKKGTLPDPDPQPEE